MANTKDKLDFTDITDLVVSNAKCKPLHDQWRKLLTPANDARSAMEDAVCERLRASGSIPKGMEPVFAYRWGKVSVAFKTAGSTKAKTSIKL